MREGSFLACIPEVTRDLLGDDLQRRSEEGVAICQSLGNHPGIPACLSRLAGIAMVEGRFEEGERLARESAGVAREGAVRTELAFAHLGLGIVLEEAGKFAEALAVLKQSLELYTDLGHHNYITEAHHFLGSVELHQGRHAEAREQAQTSLQLARANRPPYCVGLNLILLGCLALAEDADPQAYQYLHEGASALATIGGDPDVKSWARASLALTAHRLGDTPGARQHLCQVFEIARESGVVLSQLWALPVMALLLVSEGEIERAVELDALASRYPLVAQSRWFWDVVGCRLAAVAATLQPELVAAVRERGRARDLESTTSELLAELRE